VIQYKERKNRFFEEIENRDEIYDFIKSKIAKKKMSIKYDIQDRFIEINEFIDEDHNILVITDEGYEPGTDNIILVSILIDKYYEFEFHVVDTVGSGYFKCEIIGARKAITGRQDLRFKVREGDAVATNFRASKHSIEVTSFNIPTGIKVILDQYELQNRAKYDVFEVGLFDGKDLILENIKKTGRSLYIKNLADSASIAPHSDDFVDVKDILGVDFNQYIMKKKEKGYKSIIVAPIMYITDAEIPFPFAYITMISKEKEFSVEDVLKLKEESFALVDRIRDANTVLLPVKQSIYNISRGGLLLKIENDDLKKYLARARGFVFDVVFKLQAPITIYGEIKFTGLDENKNLMLGLSFAGNTSRKDQMKRLYSILEPMEVEYKKELLRQRSPK
jgi:hypothetical protein